MKMGANQINEPMRCACAFHSIVFYSLSLSLPSRAHHCCSVESKVKVPGSKAYNDSYLDFILVLIQLFLLLSIVNYKKLVD